MKPERSFVAERALAVHCPELLRAAPPPADLLPALASRTEPLARAFAAMLAPLTGGELPVVRPAPPLECNAADLAQKVSPLAANSLLGLGSDAAPLALSLDAAAVLRIVDRAFGGRGKAPSPMPEAFPLSAELMVPRIEALVIQCLSEVFSLAAPGAIRPLRRDGSFAALAPFDDEIRLAVLTFEVEEAGGASWNATLAIPLAVLAELCAPDNCKQAANSARKTTSHPADGPFGAVPLGLSAVLIDMQLPVSAISALEVGQVLPVSIARSVPLTTGGKTIAHGTIGALDERVAVQITHAFQTP